MHKLSDIPRFRDERNILLEGFDPVTAGGFTQVPNFILNHTKLSFPAKVVYAKLLSYAWHNNCVFPGQDTMAQELGTSQPTVARAVNDLETHGLLQIQRRGQGKTNLYILKHTVKTRK
jgi:biotin operon repressor